MNTDHTPSQSTREQRKSQEQHKPRLPRNPTPTITEAIGMKTRLLDRIDNEHSQRGADAGDPVDEFDVHEGAVTSAVGESGGVDEKEETQGELLPCEWLCCLMVVVMVTMGAYQCAGGVHACVAHGGVVKPFGLGPAKKTVVRDVHFAGGILSVKVRCDSEEWGVCQH